MSELHDRGDVYPLIGDLQPDSKTIDDLVRAWREAREGRLQLLTDLHGANEDRGYLIGTVRPANEVWVANVGSAVAGFIAFGRGWVNHLWHRQRRDARAAGG